MNKLSALDWVALVLVIVGGLNWGLYAFQYNLVSMLFGAGSQIEMIVYVLVGLSAIWLAVISPKLQKGM